MCGVQLSELHAVVSLSGMNKLARTNLLRPSPKLVEGEGGPIRPWLSAKSRTWTLAEGKSLTTSIYLVGL